MTVLSKKEFLRLMEEVLPDDAEINYLHFSSKMKSQIIHVDFKQNQEYKLIKLSEKEIKNLNKDK